MEYANQGLGNHNRAAHGFLREQAGNQTCQLASGTLSPNPWSLPHLFYWGQKRDSRNAVPRQTSRGARVGLRRCPILRMSKSMFSLLIH